MHVHIIYNICILCNNNSSFTLMQLIPMCLSVSTVQHAVLMLIT